MKKFPRPARSSYRPGRTKTRLSAEVADSSETESLFERFAWLYVFCREHLFRDDTERMARALWKGCGPPAGSRLLDLGCGPGFYARRLAERFRELRVTGVDRSERQLAHAHRRAASGSLENCEFRRGDARELAFPEGSVGAVVCSRLFTVVFEREAALREIHRVLEPGGRCFIAEPRSVVRAALPLRALWLLASLTYLAVPGQSPETGYREPRRVGVMTGAEFDALLATRPWAATRRWQDLWYQYAVCEKAPACRSR